jgi:hypothetical protein
MSPPSETAENGLNCSGVIFLGEYSDENLLDIPAHSIVAGNGPLFSIQKFDRKIFEENCFHKPTQCSKICEVRPQNQSLVVFVYFIEIIAFLFKNL